ncbi:hypothetical protein ACWEFL_31840 [Streptomyces sp. NPDC004838]
MPGIDECLLEAMLVPGARGASIVDWVSGLSLGTVGEAPGGDHEAMAAETAELSRVATEYAAFALLTPRAAIAAAPSGTVPDETAPAVYPPTTDGPSGAGPAHENPAAKDDGPLVEDFIVTTRTCYHVVRFVETTFDSSVFLHLWLDRDLGNLALARMRMQNLAERLVLG